MSERNIFDNLEIEEITTIECDMLELEVLRDMNRCMEKVATIDMVGRVMDEIIEEAWKSLERSRWLENLIRPTILTERETSSEFAGDTAKNDRKVNKKCSRRLEERGVGESEQERHWRESQMNWRKRKAGDVHHYGGGEVDGDRVYSPVKGTRDGNMRLAKDRRLERADREQRRWHLLRICKEIMGESGEKWRRREKEETARIKEEEKQERLRIIDIKKRKYGRKTLKKIESERLKEIREKKLELADLKKNLWRCYREGDQFTLPDDLVRPGGRKGEEREEEERTLKLSVGEVLAKKRRERLERVDLENEKWRAIREMLTSLEEETDWTTGLERDEGNEDLPDGWRQVSEQSISETHHNPAKKIRLEVTRVKVDFSELTVEHEEDFGQNDNAPKGKTQAIDGVKPVCFETRQGEKQKPRSTVQQMLEKFKHKEEILKGSTEKTEMWSSRTRNMVEQEMHGPVGNMEMARQSLTLDARGSRADLMNLNLCDAPQDLVEPEKKVNLSVSGEITSYRAAKAAQTERFSDGIGRPGDSSSDLGDQPIREEIGIVQRMRKKFAKR